MYRETCQKKTEAVIFCLQNAKCTVNELNFYCQDYITFCLTCIPEQRELFVLIYIPDSVLAPKLEKSNHLEKICIR